MRMSFIVLRMSDSVSYISLINTSVTCSSSKRPRDFRPDPFLGRTTRHVAAQAALEQSRAAGNTSAATRVGCRKAGTGRHARPMIAAHHGALDGLIVQQVFHMGDELVHARFLAGIASTGSSGAITLQWLARCAAHARQSSDRPNMPCNSRTTGLLFVLAQFITPSIQPLLPVPDRLTSLRYPVNPREAIATPIRCGRLPIASGRVEGEPPGEPSRLDDGHAYSVTATV